MRLQDLLDRALELAPAGVIQITRVGREYRVGWEIDDDALPFPFAMRQHLSLKTALQESIDLMLAHARR